MWNSPEVLFKRRYQNRRVDWSYQRIEPEAVIRLGRTIRIKREYVDRLYAQHTGWTGMERVA